MEKVLKTLSDLVKIPSVSGNEKEIRKILDYSKKYFDGKKVFFREFGYEGASPVVLISNTSTDNFDIMVVGHLDVVPAQNTDQFKPKIDGDKLIGRGALDMKFAIAVAFESMDYILEHNLDIDFAILITTDEETSSNGIKNFVKNEEVSARIVLDNDVTDMTTIVEKYKHSVGVKITTSGESAHSSRAWDSVNAVNKLLNVLSKLQKSFKQYEKGINVPKDTWVDTMAITILKTPEVLNTIPDWAEAQVNFRLTDKTSLKDLENILSKACEGNNATYDIFMKSCGCYMDANNKYIQMYKKIAEKAMGKKIKITHMNGATDARMFADKSVIIMHGADGEGIHQKDEYIKIPSILKAAEIQKEFIKSVIKEKK